VPHTSLRTCLRPLHRVQPFAADAPKTKLVDLVMAVGQVRLLIELKTIITNYGQPGKDVT
jgi:hypothetical protein